MDEKVMHLAEALAEVRAFVVANGIPEAEIAPVLRWIEIKHTSGLKAAHRYFRALPREQQKHANEAARRLRILISGKLGEEQAEQLFAIPGRRQ